MKRSTKRREEKEEAEKRVEKNNSFARNVKTMQRRDSEILKRQNK